MKISQLNIAEESDAFEFLLQCCASKRWAKELLEKRPYKSVEYILQYSEHVWKNLSVIDYMEAFDAHPKIGEMKEEKSPGDLSSALSAAEQSSVERATEEILEKLKLKNQSYFDKFGFIFIVFATGKEAFEMLQILEARMENSLEEEIKIAAAEQSKITHQRLRSILE